MRMCADESLANYECNATYRDGFVGHRFYAAMATVFSTAGFAAVSGASVATSAVFARIAIPEMLRIGYDKRFAAGVVAASGTLASLIPPSAILVIYAIIWGVLLYVRFLGFADLPNAFSDWIAGLDQNPMITLLLILLAYALLGTATGCAIWFGIIVVKMAEFCLITPPIGLNCFVVAGVRPELTVQDVFRGVTPFFIADIITIGTLIAFPAIVLWLPGIIMGIV